MRQGLLQGHVQASQVDIFYKLFLLQNVDKFHQYFINLIHQGASRDDSHGARAMEVRRLREAVWRSVEPAVPRTQSGLHQEDQVLRLRRVAIVDPMGLIKRLLVKSDLCTNKRQTIVFLLQTD